MKKIKFVTFGILVVAVALSMFAGCSKKNAGSSTVTDTSLESILSKKKFVLGLDDSFPPMGYRNEQNEIVGYDIDLAKEVTRRLGVALVLQPIDWNAKEQELATGEIDCIWNGFSITSERKSKLSFSKPYLRNSQVVVVRAASGFKALADLTGKIAGLQAGSSAADALDAADAFKNSLKDVIEYKDNLTALMDLDVGGADAIILDLVVANDNIRRSGKSFRILDEALGAEEFGIGFRKADIALTNKVDETLASMAQDGTIAKISTTWFGSDISIISK
jgi:polar amino acid transport system substrate-binding protein